MNKFACPCSDRLYATSCFIIVPFELTNNEDKTRVCNTERAHVTVILVFFNLRIIFHLLPTPFYCNL